MQKFIAKFGSLIQGVLSGTDRLVFRGSLRAIQYSYGLMGYLWHKQVPLTGFGKHAEEVTKQIKKASLAEAERLGRPVQYLVSSKIDKKTRAEEIAVRDKIQNGLICVLSCVEPCMSFEVGPNPAEKKLEVKHRLRKCLFLYHYWQHPEFGFMSARIQTWFPFQVQIYLNESGWRNRCSVKDWPTSGTKTVFHGSRTTPARRSCWTPNSRRTGVKRWGPSPTS